MSAYIESKAHIDALVTLVRNGPTDREINPGNAWYGMTYCNPARLTPDELGAVLIAENIRSVQRRYNGEAIETLPGPVDKASLLDYRHEAHGLSAIEGLAAIDGYEYQACEHPDWERSDAYAICDSLRRALVRQLPGYAEAGTWSIASPRSFQPDQQNVCQHCGHWEADHDRRYDLDGAPLLCLA